MTHSDRPREGTQTTAARTGAEARWQRRPARQRGALRYLLDLDSELAESLDVNMRLAARRMATAVIFDAEAGAIDLSSWWPKIGDGPGILVVEGILVVNVTVGGRIASELLGPGDLLEPGGTEDDELLTCATAWRILLPARFAVLDGGFSQRVVRWPQLHQVLLRRAERRLHSLNVQRAIACQPRLEIRLALLLGHLASRWGRVEPGGVALTLPLTHQLLGRMVGAERPSVSHALARLTRSGLVTSEGDDWHLHARVDAGFDAMLDGVPAGVASLHAAAGGSG